MLDSLGPPWVGFLARNPRMMVECRLRMPVVRSRPVDAFPFWGRKTDRCVGWATRWCEGAPSSLSC